MQRWKAISSVCLAGRFDGIKGRGVNYPGILTSTLDAVNEQLHVPTALRQEHLIFVYEAGWASEPCESRKKIQTPLPRIEHSFLSSTVPPSWRIFYCTWTLHDDWYKRNIVTFSMPLCLCQLFCFAHCEHVHEAGRYAYLGCSQSTKTLNLDPLLW
jgi:hypothetical protein